MWGGNCLATEYMTGTTPTESLEESEDVSDDTVSKCTGHIEEAAVTDGILTFVGKEEMLQVHKEGVTGL